MTTSQLVDRLGQPMVIKSGEAPNLDPDFWNPNLDHGATTKNVTTMPYAYHVWSFVCVKAISQNVSILVKFLQSKKDRSIQEEHPVLALLAKPNSIMQQSTFLRMILSQLLLPATKGGVISGGQSFIIPWNTKRDDKVRLDKGEMPDELFPYPETYFTPWLGEEDTGRRQFKGWKFEVPQAPKSAIYFENGEIIRINMLNPYDVLKGMSPFSPIASSVELDAKADTFNADIFANSGRLDGQVSSEQYIEQPELQKVKKAWYEQYTGLHRQRVAFLSGGLKYEQYALSSTDLQYIDQGKWSRQKILGAYGLNRIAAGDYEDINFATIREGRKILWYDTYIPIDKMILDAFNGQWVRYVDQGKYELVSDYTKVPALQADMQDRAKTAGILVSQVGYPPSLASRIVELPLREDDLKKWPHLDQQLSGKATPEVAPQNPPAKSVSKSMERDYSQEYITNVLDPGEKLFRRPLEKFFIDQRNKIMDMADVWSKRNKSIPTELMYQLGAPPRETPAISAWEFLPDQIRENLDIIKIFKPAAKSQAILEKKQIELEFGRSIQWDADDIRMQYWTNQRSVFLEDINTNTFKVAGDAIAATIKQGIADGLIPGELAKQIKQAVHDVYDVRLGKPVIPNGQYDLGGMSSSQTIARTEMGTIASLTRFEAFKNEGVESIEWVTSMDDRVRDSHASINEQQVTLGYEFGNGLRYPRDPNGDAGEVINCRCAFIAVVPKV